MRVTKYEHAALRIETAGKAILVDPGAFTSPIDDLHNVIGVVITHEHPDHWTPDHLDRILAAVPGVPILAPEGVAHAASGYDITVVKPGDTVALEPFTLEFFGGEHAVIHASIPVIDNVGVLVNGQFYYPGDSYAVPKGADVTLLAAPIGAPWLKIGDAMDFVLAVKPRRAFGTHDKVLSQIGKQFGQARLTWAVEQNGGEFVALDDGEATDV
jgi:L-ascorbate metabolism protein UlaG (beta-lactamase superfamily)